MAERGHTVTADFIRRGSKAIRKSEKDPAIDQVKRQVIWPSDNIVLGVLTSAITAATPNGLTGATNFTFKIWRLDPTDSSDPRQMIQDADDTTGVNRGQRTADSGKFGYFVYINGEWNPLEIDCDTP